MSHRHGPIRYVFTKFQDFKSLVNILNTFIQMYEIWIYRDKEVHPVLNQSRVIKYGNILVFLEITSGGSFRLSTKGKIIED